MLTVIRKIWDFADTQHGRLKISVVLNLFRAMFSLFDYFAIYLGIAGLVEHSITTALIVQCISLIAAGVIGRMMMDGISSLKLMETGYGAAKEKRLHVGDKLRYVPMGCLGKLNLGEISAALTTTIGEIETLAPMVLVQFISGIMGTAFMAAYVAVLNWQIGVIALGAIVVYFFVAGCQQKALEKLTGLRQQAQDELIFQVLEYLQGIQVIKGFGLFDKENKAVTDAVEKSCKDNTALNVKSIPWAHGQRLILSLFSVAVCMSALVQYLNGSLELSLCLFMLIMSFVLFSSLDFAGSSIGFLNLIDVAITQVNKIDALPVVKNGTLTQVPNAYDIEFEQVSFSYDKKQVLEELNAHLPEKEITAVIGRSGSGKTTLTHLLARFWDVDKGSVRLNGADIRDYDYDTLLSQISYVFQAVYLFHDTVENNIGFGRYGASHEEIMKAAEKAGCHDFIMDLPEGYDTIIGEAGSSLSGGEKQRISIARAILKDAPIIILDEATASVDPENEWNIMQAIHELVKDKTCIIIAHRLNTVRRAGQILVLDKGRIAQKGTHDQLIQQDGIYRQFIRHKEQAGKWKI